MDFIFHQQENEFSEFAKYFEKIVYLTDIKSLFAFQLTNTARVTVDSYDEWRRYNPRKEFERLKLTSEDW